MWLLVVRSAVLKQSVQFYIVDPMQFDESLVRLTVVEPHAGFQINIDCGIFNF